MAVNMEKNKYFYAIVVIAATVICSLLLIFLVVRPLYIGNQKLGAEVQQKREKLDALEAKLAKLKVLKKDEERLVKEKEKVLAALPKDKDVPRLFVQFEKMASSTGATVSAAVDSSASTTAAQATSTETTIPGLNTYTYELTANTSTYESLKNIFSNSETALRLLNIEGFSISKKDTTLDVSFSLKTFGRTEELQ